MLAKLMPECSHEKFSTTNKLVLVNPKTDLKKLPERHPWLKKRRLVVKVDQLVKRRGKHKLLLLDSSWSEALRWIKKYRGKPVTIEKRTDTLDYFLIEPFIPHELDDEHYLSIRSLREGEEILFHSRGGVDVGDIDSKAERITIPVSEDIENVDVSRLLRKVSNEKRVILGEFIKGLFRFYVKCDYTFMEINPLVVSNNKVFPIDLAAKLDDTAEFENTENWNGLEFPPPFGKKLSPEEEYVKNLDEKTGASLKLTILNPHGRVWTMVSGGGASVVFADTIVDLDFGNELANYGEYSGNPSEEFTYEYAKNILDLMTREKDPRGRNKVLLIGGSIANFTDIAKTFNGIIHALREYESKLKRVKAKIYVRRGGPNYREGLKNMRKLGETLGVPIEVYGPETHMTNIVSMALKPRGKR